MYKLPLWVSFWDMYCTEQNMLYRQTKQLAPRSVVGKGRPECNNETKFFFLRRKQGALSSTKDSYGKDK